MLRNPNQREIAAFARLKADADFAVVINFIEDSQRALQREVMFTRDDAAVRQQQGAMQTLSSLLELASVAGEVAHRQRNT